MKDLAKMGLAALFQLSVISYQLTVALKIVGAEKG